MKTFAVVFALFFVAEYYVIRAQNNNNNWLVSRRKRLPLETNGFVEFLRSLTEFDFYQTLLDADRDTFYRVRFQGDTVFADVHDRLRAIACRSLALGYVYSAIHMTEYFLSLRLYTRKFPGWNLSGGLRSLVGLRDHGRGGGGWSCMFSAFHDCDCGIDVDRMLDGFFFAQSLAKDNGRLYARETLIDRMGAYRQHFGNYVRSRANSHLPHAAGVARRSKTIEQGIGQVKKAIVRFSQAFCSRWRPIAPTILLPAHRRVDYRQHQSMFVRYIFTKKVCALQVNLDDSPWNCNVIMIMQFYGYLRYEDVITQVMKQKTWWDPGNFDKMEKYSLGTLRDVFADELVGYRNAMNYDEIATTAMLLFAIKEGVKILVGIKHAVKSHCSDRTTVEPNTGGEVRCRTNEDDTYWVIHDVRSTLSVFKSQFDNLVALMLNEKRIGVTDNQHKTWFDSEVKTVLRLLNVQPERTDNGMSMRKMCTEVLTLLDKSIYDTLYAFNCDIFSEFFLTLPVLNIKRLYRFYAYEYL